ncbi:COG1615 family transporter, partial [Clostridium botulinum C/D]
MKKNKTAIIGIICLGLIVVFLRKIVNVIINIKWFKEIGYLSVYFTRIITIVALMLLVFVICFLSIKLYFKSIKNNISKHKDFIDVDFGNEKIQNRVINILNIGISLF